MSDVTTEILTIRNCIKSPPVAYFCAEFAIDERLPIYAGGLGILAGDVLGQANEDGRSFVGIGMLYHGGYLRQEISADANIHTTELLDPVKAGLSLVVEQGKPVIITVPIHARQVQVKAWVQYVGNVPLILLDTDVEGNEAQDIKLCDQLYVGDKEHRFKQEMILGIGGARMLHRLGITPRLYHLNEGHSALLLFEIAHHRLHFGETNVQETLEHLGNIVFTNHTLVPAGNDVFSKDLVISYLSSFALEFPVDPANLVKFGLIQDTSLFSPTMLALRLATVNQAVSQLHAAKALEMWPDHPMIGITNGVRQQYWQSPKIADSLQTTDYRKLWDAHNEQKQKLLAYIKELTGFEWPADSMVITWARRLANYKRPLILFEQMERLEALLAHSPPVRILMSGKPHAHDEAAQDNLKKILELVGKYDGKIVYLQNYSIEMAKLMHSGSDVLLNTPIRGFEACGTSGMKASMNGVLQCTTLDGWTDEVKWEEIGWVIDDASASTCVYDHLEQSIVPLYFKRDEAGIPQEWVERMQRTIGVAVPQYTAKRMLEELDAKVYSQIKTE